MSFLDLLVDVDYYIKKANIRHLTRLEIKHVVEFFEFVGESPTMAAETLDLNTKERLEDIKKLLRTFKELQGTLNDC